MHMPVWIKRKQPDGIDENAQSLCSFNFFTKSLDLAPSRSGFHSGIMVRLSNTRACYR